MDIVFDQEEVVLGWVYAVGSAGIYVFGILDKGGRVIEVAFGVQVKVGGVIAHVIQVVGTSSVAGRIGWTQICWNDTENVAKCHFVVVYLVIELRSG